LLGGKLKPSGSITDSLAIEFARQFTIDLCFATGVGLPYKKSLFKGSIFASSILNWVILG
jgi:DeoR/GlpR family transcriptional regulator of sugar metabolism